MKRHIPYILSLCLVLAVCLVVDNAKAAEQEPFVVHFVVLPVQKDDAKVREFKKIAVAIAGGYTDLGATSGGSMHDGEIRSQENTTLIIGAEKDISKDLKVLTKSLFGGNGAFIMSWEGKVLF